MATDRLSYTSKEKEDVELSVDAVIKDEDADEARKLVGDKRVVFSEEEQARVRRKIDWRVPPILAAVYFTQFLDKTSLNYSSVMGLPITGEDYNLVSLAFYLGFLVWEMPTNYIAQRLPLAKYLGANVIIWAATLMLHAAAPTFAPFFVLRFILGMCESCVAPILIAMVAAWYPKNEQSTRIATFYVMNGLTMIFGGLLAYGVTFYAGNKIEHWRIIFILLGGLAFIVGTVVLVFLPDSPATAKFLSEEDRIIAIERVRDNQSGTVNRHFKRDQFVEAIKDVRTWLIVLAALISSIPNGGFSNFTSIIIKSFGYTSRESLLLALPQGAVAAITTVTVCYWADKKNQRMLPILGTAIPTIIGAAMLVGFDHDRIRFKAGCIVGICLLSSYGSALSILYAWNAANIGGSTKKTTVNALLVASFALGNIIGTQIFQAKDAPGYLPGKIASLIIFCCLAVLCLFMRWVNIRLNVKKAKVLAETIAANGWTDDDVRRESEKAAFLDMTDKKNIFFTYLP